MYDENNYQFFLRLENRMSLIGDFGEKTFAEKLMEELQKEIRSRNHYVKVFQDHIKRDKNKDMVLLLKKRPQRT